ncbi:hypothetical protein FCIRC_9237 [Fusarium circinatum]|uniref:F-box domain-containing protein n=1 Tax=Fusarium circinatum TaxID=48490 RepID=A0A8H5WT93_FUSCI|nr:hypothetical protein FCIRC_9237 [Fusarium circinatum]
MDDSITKSSMNNLEEMPVEILLTIASHLDCYDFRVITFVSWRLRSALAPSLFKMIIFSGTLEKIAHDMKSLLGGESQNLMELILSSAKYSLHPRIRCVGPLTDDAPRLVTISLEACHCAEGFNEANLLEDIMETMSKFVSKLSSTHMIAFDFGVDGQIATHHPGHAHLQAALDLLRMIPQWNGPKTVDFPSPTDALAFGTIMRQFSRCSIKAVRFPPASFARPRDILRSTLSSVKGLRIDMSGMRTESRTLACIDDKYLCLLSRDFPHLQSLFLDQLDTDGFKSHVGHITRKSIFPKIVRVNLFPDVSLLTYAWQAPYFEKLISRLKTMPRLLRFAFTLTKDWQVNEYECTRYLWNGTLSFDSTLHAIPQADKWGVLLDFNAAEVEWHYDHITRILNAVPQVEELCIVPHTLELYRGIKIGGAVSVRLVEYHDPGEDFRFPRQLLD